MKSIKQLCIIALVAMFSLSTISLTAQNTRVEKQEQKQQEKQQKETKAELYTRADKQARKEAKKLEKEGWKTMGLPIDKQLDETWMKIYEKDAGGYPRYVVIQNITTANSYSAAQSQAENVAKLRIAGEISSSIGALTDLALSNKEISAKEAASITQSIENAKVLVSQKLGRVIKVQEIYKTLSNGNYQVRVVLAYDVKTAMTIARQAILDELQKDTDINRQQLEKIMGMDNLLNQYGNDHQGENYDNISE